MNNVVHLDVNQRNKQPSNDWSLSDLPVMGMIFIDRYGKSVRYKLFQILVMLIVAGFFAYVDWSLIFELFKAKFCDPVTGKISNASEILVGVASFLTVVGFFVIGRFAHQGKYAFSLVLYLTIILLLTLCLRSIWGSEIKLLFVGNIHIGLATNPDPNGGNDNALIWVRLLYLVGIAIAFSLAGIAFSLVEWGIEKTYFALIELKQDLDESHARVNDYNVEKSRADKLEEDKAIVELLSEPDTVDSILKKVTRAYFEAYTSTLSEQKEGLSKISFTMTRASQTETASKRNQLEQLLTQANTLQIP